LKIQKLGAARANFWNDRIKTMATKIQMRHKENGLPKTGFMGFSWTTLIFGIFVPVFRFDWLTLVASIAVHMILAVTTLGIGNVIAWIVWSFYYNKYYTIKLIKKGYEFSDSLEANGRASAMVGLSGWRV
jgi:hypothetical protein